MATTLRTVCLTPARQNSSYVYVVMHVRHKVGGGLPYCNAMYLAPSTVYKPLRREEKFQAYRHTDMQQFPC